MTPLVAVLVPGAVNAESPPDSDRTAIRINRKWDVLRPVGDDPRAGYLEAGRLLGDWPLFVAGKRLDGPMLIDLAQREPTEPFVRLVRETLARPFDVHDLLFFLDDVLAAGERGELVWVPSGRARGAGILLHPDDVFFNRPRRYGERKQRLNIDKPPPPRNLPAAQDGELLGPNWTARFKNPSGERHKMKALAETNPAGDFAARVDSLIEQLRKQGCMVHVGSTVRNRARGYLMWGAFVLSRAGSESALMRLVSKLEERNFQWELNVPIQWLHPKGWQATIEAARRMADAYDVVFATESGARKSKHYDGLAVDVSVVGLPRELTLTAPNGTQRTFDLSAPEQARDLSLTPEVIAWVEAQFGMKKLRSDYPHWTDGAAGRN